MSRNNHSRIEDLSNELWPEIFEYLDWINIFQGFYNLNKRINQLLLSIKRLSLYSSYLIKHTDNIYIFFQEFPLKEFKYIKHFRLILDNSYEDSLIIIQHLPLFPNLASINIIDYCVEYWRYLLIHELGSMYICKHYPFLQDMNTICTFDYPLLRRIEVRQLSFKMALQILNQCPNLCVFSSEIQIGLGDSNLTPSSIPIPNRVNMGLLALKKLHINLDGTCKLDLICAIILVLLRCCPNLYTFCCEVQCIGRNNPIVDPFWWSNALASKKKLQRISLQLGIFGALNRLSEDVVLKFQQLPFFARFNVNLTYTVRRYEFPHMEHIYLIKN